MFQIEPKPRNQENANPNLTPKPTGLTKPDPKPKPRKPASGNTEPTEVAEISGHHHDQPRKPQIAEKSQPNPLKKYYPNLPPTRSFGKPPRKNTLTDEKFVTPHPLKIEA